MKTIHHVFEIAAPPGEIFAALTTTEGLSGWWTTKVSAQAEIGAVVDFTTHHWPLSESWVMITVKDGKAVRLAE